MITPWEIYWVLQLDSINAAITFFAFIAALVGGVALIASAFCQFDSDPDAWCAESNKQIAARNKLRAPRLFGVAWRVLLFAAAPAWVIATFLPSTSTAAAMIIAPKIINSPTVQHEAGDLYKLAKQALENAVSPKQDDKGGAK